MAKLGETKKKTVRHLGNFVVGIDEVGRGPVAGPVTVCAVLMSRKNYQNFLKSNQIKKLRDSKKLTPIRREEWFIKIKEWQKGGNLDFVLKSISAKEIDKKGIAVCIRKCLCDVLSKIEAPTDAEVLLDGSLYAPTEFVNQKTIIKGDEKIPIISLASIVAKVSRDKFMVDCHRDFPEYGFKDHKGYGTAAHIKSIKKIGPSEFHRKTFLKSVLAKKDLI